jgi:hypothetical protein
MPSPQMALSPNDFELAEIGITKSNKKKYGRMTSLIRITLYCEFAFMER